MSESPLVTLVFGNMTAALLLLKRTLPRASAEAWQAMQGACFTGNGGLGSFFLHLPQALASGSHFEQALRILGGSIQKKKTPPEAGDHIKLTDLFKHVAFTPSPLTERARQFIVLPRAAHADLSRLVGALAELCDWQISLHATSGEKQSYFFFLESVSGLDEPLPMGLPGVPVVLAATADGVFVPPGLVHPFLPQYRFLFPPLQAGQRHSWVTNPQGLPEYFLLQETPDSGTPLARKVTLKSVRGSSFFSTGSSDKIQVALELQKSSTRKGLPRDASRTVYRIETRAGEFGHLLLRFLDHAEAGIENFTYYIRPLGEGPNALIEHYLLAEERIRDEQSWPGLSRFYSPRILEDLSLPIFLPENRHFAPDIEGLLRTADADEPLLLQLAEATGFAIESKARGTASGEKIAVLLPESSGQDWSVLHLENGKPLAEAIQATSRAYNREAIRRVLRVNPPSLEDERKHYEERWIDAGTREAQEIAELTTECAQELQQAAVRMDAELQEHETRLRDVEGVLGLAGALVTEHLPVSVREYVERTLQIISELTAPQHSFLQQLDMRANQLAQLQEDVKTLQRQAARDVELLIQQRITSEQEIENNQGRLATQVSSLTSAGNELTGSVARAEVAAGHASAAMQIRQAALQQQLSAVESLESQVLQEDARLDGVQNDLERREREVAARRRQHTVRRQELERRADQVQQSIRLAEQEQARLHLIENVEIPARERDLKELESTLAEFKKRGIEESLEEVKTKLSVEGSRLTQLKQAEESLRQLHRELAQKVAEVQDTISREKKLRKLVVNEESTLSAAAKRLPDNPASTQNVEAAKSKTSLVKRIFWGFGK